MEDVKRQPNDAKRQPNVRYTMLQSSDSVTSSLDTLSDYTMLQSSDSADDSLDTLSNSVTTPSVAQPQNIIRTKRKLKHELECTADILNSTALTTRHLTMDDLIPWYDEEQLDELIDIGNTPAPTLSDIRYEEAFNAFLEECQDNNKRRIWTTAEDDFLRRNYKHLSDNTIALALNIPNQQVINRRTYLKLEKGQRTSEYEIPIIVWADRKDFDLDCARFRLTKVRDSYVSRG